jgi:hypothetical protein
MGYLHQEALVDGYVAFSRAEMAQGNTERALESAREANSLAQRSGAGEEIVEAAETDQDRRPGGVKLRVQARCTKRP